MIQLLVTGTGRCGTGYVAELLTAAGIPCGHEDVYTPWGIVTQPGLAADASWLAVPSLKAFHGRLVQLVRHPLAVIRSFVSIGFFREHLDWPHRAFAFQHFERTGPEISDAMRWYLQWNARIEPYASIRIRVEDLPGRLPDLVGRPISWSEEPPHTTNGRPRSDIGPLPGGPLLEELRGMALRYGYQLEKVADA
jgi:hypothetical protein